MAQMEVLYIKIEYDDYIRTSKRHVLTKKYVKRIYNTMVIWENYLPHKLLFERIWNNQTKEILLFWEELNHIIIFDISLFVKKLMHLIFRDMMNKENVKYVFEIIFKIASMSEFKEKKYLSLYVMFLLMIVWKNS